MSPVCVSDTPHSVEGEGPLEIGSWAGAHRGHGHRAARRRPFAEPVFAGAHRLNGNGELTGLEWIREAGLLSSPIALTNTNSVGVVRDALVIAATQSRPAGDSVWSLPVVGETWDGWLNDIDGQHVRPEHVFAALEQAGAGPVPEGAVGGGTGHDVPRLQGWHRHRVSPSRR